MSIPVPKLLRLTAPAARLLWLSDRREVLVTVALQALGGLAFPAQVLAGKWALDEVVQASRTGAGIEAALPATAVAVAALAGARLIMSVSSERRMLLPQIVARTVHELLGQKVLSLDLATLERPEFADRLARTQRQAFHSMNMVSDMMALVTSAVAIVGLALVLLAIEPILVLAAVLTFVPVWLASIRSGRDFYRHMVRNTQGDRRIQYLGGLLTDPAAAKETQAFGLGDYLLGRRRSLYEEKLEDLRGIVRRAVRRHVVMGTLSSAVTGAALLFVLWLHFGGSLSIADAVAAAGAMLLLSVRLGATATTSGRFYENALFARDFWSLLDLLPEQRTTAPALPPPPGLDRLRLEEVTFTYPDAERSALCGVSMEIRHGETVALVGANGAGKTTLAKLLCRLYDPERGAITWDGRDIRSCEPEQLRRRIAVIFQDFTHYALSVRENVGFGDVGSIDDVAGIAEAARNAGADEFLARLPEGYETTLGRLFDGAHQLSLGQWQRVALARAFFRCAPLVIMDEPTASLDARAEAEMFETMRRLFADRAVLLISHRFSSVRMADRIYVLDEGRVVEQGSHDELLAAGGLYADLFTTQAAAYLGEQAAAGPGLR